MVVNAFVDWGGCRHLQADRAFQLALQLQDLPLQEVLQVSVSSLLLSLRFAVRFFQTQFCNFTLDKRNL